MSGTRIDILEAQVAAQKIGIAARDMETYAQNLHNSVEKIGEYWQGQAYRKFYTLAADLNLQLKKSHESVMTIYTGVTHAMHGYAAQDAQ